MSPLSRREAGKLLLAGYAGLVTAGKRVLGAEKIDSVIRGVEIGAQSYSFRDRPLAACLEAYRTAALGECELYQGHVEPREKASREESRKRRLTTPPSLLRGVRRPAGNAATLLHASNDSFPEDMSAATN